MTDFICPHCRGLVELDGRSNIGGGVMQEVRVESELPLFAWVLLCVLVVLVGWNAYMLTCRPTVVEVERVVEVVVPQPAPVVNVDVAKLINRRLAVEFQDGVVSGMRAYASLVKGGVGVDKVGIRQGLGVAGKFRGQNGEIFEKLKQEEQNAKSKPEPNN